MAGLKISVEEIDKKSVLRLNGRLDATTVLLIEEKIESLIQNKRVNILLDFEEVDYLSSAGLRFLLSYNSKLSSLQGIFILFSIQEEVKSIIKIAGFDKLLKIYANEKEALKRV